jgi:hypothetical protein
VFVCSEGAAQYSHINADVQRRNDKRGMLHFSADGPAIILHDRSHKET